MYFLYIRRPDSAPEVDSIEVQFELEFHRLNALKQFKVAKSENIFSEAPRSKLGKGSKTVGGGPPPAPGASTDEIFPKS